ncbi:hypothetical protein GP486_000705 [Trichoglossum hirsutum]|uniref:Folic acid synthesis protein FOL1 n=1 Tax=Trichoglossum hirsutum TaxID=265104 RepID=A0A9P8LIE6_9PEZI|nr:hypothetical protein GP486_000705 [Trichoglossum hirsutum]
MVLLRKIPSVRTNLSILRRKLYNHNAKDCKSAARETDNDLSVSVFLRANSILASAEDGVERTIGHHQVYESLKKIAAENRFSTDIYHVGRIVADHALTISPKIQEARIRIRLLGKEGSHLEKSGPDLIDRSQHGELQISKLREDPPLKGTISQTWSTELIEYTVKNLPLKVAIGTLTHKRGRDQPILLDVTLRAQARDNVRNDDDQRLGGNHVSSNSQPALGYFRLIDDIVELVDTSSFLTTEALASKIADIMFSSWSSKGIPHTLDEVTIRIRKPGVYKEASTVGVEITRTKAMHGSADSGFITQLNAKGKHQAFIALGSNLGDRVGMIQRACTEMDQRGIRVVRTSGLWETDAMYVEEQPRFINGACEVETMLAPIELLDQLQDIENMLGRKKLVEKGPRNIDLDILLYDDLAMNEERLTIPHKLMFEREFVLRPLCESTLVMAILNLSPDSFSNDGRHCNNATDIIDTVSAFISSGASIIDIGGQSTRPGASDVGEQEELARVLPAINAIRSSPLICHVCISVDTYRSSVAEAAIAAGADIINDISAGVMDPDMFPTLARLGCTVCLMHTRGTPLNMTSLTDYPNGVIPTVAAELLGRIRAAEATGIRRWRIILDPGIGFAKTQNQNLEILRSLDALRDYEGLHGLPWLVGPSRKGFVGRITGVAKPKNRTWGTAGALAACVAGGADIVRVHDVSEMSKVVKMADAIWRV